jgi:hypothetical protein
MHARHTFGLSVSSPPITTPWEAKVTRASFGWPTAIAWQMPRIVVSRQLHLERKKE